MGKMTSRIISCILLLSILFSIASCGKLSGKNKKMITKDSPWFDCEVFRVGFEGDPDKKLAHKAESVIGCDEQYIIVEVFVDYEIPEGLVEGKDYSYHEYNNQVISVIDRASHKTVNTIDPAELFEMYEDLETVIYSDGIITVKTDMNERDYDPKTGDVLASRKAVKDSSMDYSVISSIYKTGDYKIVSDLYSPNEGFSYCKLTITTSQGQSFKTELKEPGRDIEVSDIIQLSETEILVSAYSGLAKIYYEVDLVSGAVKTADNKEYEFLDNVDSWSSFHAPDGMIYYPTDYGIMGVNVKTKTVEEALNYSWSNVNTGLVNWSYLIDCSKDSFLVMATDNPDGLYADETVNEMCFIEFNRAASNPHAGKTILELYSFKDINVILGDAIVKFNEKNERCYLEPVSRYNYYDFIDFESASEDSYDSRMMEDLNANGGLSNKLAIDIMSGTGPDILIGATRFEQLNNQDYLADLSPYVGSLDPDKYFMNIIDGAKKDGVMYQLPLSFAVKGIVTDSANAGKTGTGFTLEEYGKYLYGQLNGTDAIYCGRSFYFVTLFNSMSDVFIKNGKADFTVPEFRELADFVKDNVSEKGVLIDDLLEDYSQKNGVYTSCTGIGNLFSVQVMIKNKPVCLGVPSSDGRGPVFESDFSVAISKSASDIDACGEFVKILLSDDIQEAVAKNDKFVVNRDAFRKVGKIAFDYYNKGGRRCSNPYIYGGAWIYTSLGKLSEKDLDNFECIIESCSGRYSDDSPVSVILIEEMPAYFLGQKDLDSVIKIAQDRIQKVLDERGR